MADDKPKYKDWETGRACDEYKTCSTPWIPEDEWPCPSGHHNKHKKEFKDENERRIEAYSGEQYSNGGPRTWTPKQAHELLKAGKKAPIVRPDNKMPII
jgi:hypothetical protein